MLSKKAIFFHICIRALEGSAKRNSQVCWSLLIDKAMFSMQELYVQHG